MTDIRETISFTLLLIKKLQEGPMNQTQIADQLGINKNRLARYIEALKAHGIIEKTMDPGPPRQAIIQLTPLGRCIAKCLTQMR